MNFEPEQIPKCKYFEVSDDYSYVDFDSNKFKYVICNAPRIKSLILPPTINVLNDGSLRRFTNLQKLTVTSNEMTICKNFLIADKWIIDWEQISDHEFVFDSYLIKITSDNNVKPVQDDDYERTLYIVFDDFAIQKFEYSMKITKRF